MPRAVKYAPRDITDTARIAAQLHNLVGLRLSIVRRAADMLCLHFGDVRKVDGGTVGEFALHVQCPWRLEGPNGSIVGYVDLWTPADADAVVEGEPWHYDRDLNLQDAKLAAYFALEQGRVGRAELVVVATTMSGFGDGSLAFRDGSRLVLFPAGACGEHWRLFHPATKRRHFVVEGDGASRS